MKRVTKILLLLLIATLICTVAGVYAASATADTGTTGKAQNSTYAFKIFTPSSANGTTGSVKYYTSSSEDLKKLRSHLGNGDVTGSVVTLLSDITVTYADCKNGDTLWTKDAAWSISSTKYIDLNGYSITFVASPGNSASKCYGIELNPDATLYLYSSDPNYKGQIFTYADGTQYVAATSEAADAYKGQDIPVFNMRYNNSTLYFGTVDNAPVLDSTGKNIISRSRVSGDNIVTYVSALFSSAKARYRENPVGANAYIRGGTHYHTNDEASLISSQTGVNITVEDATLITTGYGSLISTKVNMGTYTQSEVTNYIAPADGNITVNRCVMYANSYVMQEAYESMSTDNTYEGGIKLSSIVFNDCYFSGNVVKSSGNNGSPDFNNCYFVSPATTPGTTNKIVSANKELHLSIPTVTYEYASDASVSMSVSAAKSVTVSMSVKTATAGNYATITWIGYGKTAETYWDNDGSTVPSPVFIGKYTDVYKYQYGSVIEPVTNDATYELVPSVNFSFKSNLTLYAHFIYNVYIPKDIADSDDFISVSLAGKTAELNTVITVDGTQYYVISYELPAKIADQSFDLVMTLKGYEETFTSTKSLSIPEYVSTVASGNYSAEAKALVNSAYTYIKAARNYYDDADVYTVPTLTEIIGQPASSIPTSLSNVLNGVTLELSGNIKFRLFLYQNAPDFTLSYQVNNVRSEFKPSKDDMVNIPDSNLCYYDVSLSAFDLRDSIRVIAEDGTTYYYSLANYVNSVQNESKHLTTLMNALWEYSLCSETYASVYNSQSPTVNVTVSGSKIDAIVATGSEELKAAELIQDALRKITGETVPITSAVGSGANIIVSIVPPYIANDARAYVSGGDLYVECGYASFTESAAEQFVNEYILRLGASYDFKDSFYASYFTDKIYYSDFGAKGDGVTNDFFAMKATHDMANATKRHTVLADSGKTYLIEDTRDGFGKANYISIATNVNWGNSNIIIKDTNFSAFDGTGVTGQNVFVIVPDSAEVKISDRATMQSILASGLGIGTTKIDLGIGKAAMIMPYNLSHKIYRRIGYGKYDGQDMHEVIIIDENGNVDPTTPVMFNYSSLDYVLVYDLDETPITIEGGIITTYASHVDIVIRDASGNATGAHNTFINRGMLIKRSNTTIKNVKHYVEGEITLAEQEEGILGAPYHGFFSTDSVNNVTFDSCVLTGRRCYSKTYVAGAGSGATGSYGYTVDASNNVTFKNCVQSNFWIKPIYDDAGKVIRIDVAQEGEDGAQPSMTRIQYKPGSKINFKRYWGLGGANHSKNMSFIGSRLSRFDSHSGLYNAYIIDSEINGISIVGGGEAIIENSRWFSNADGGCDSFVDLRGDYGSPWNGTITIKDSTGYLNPNYYFSVIGTSYRNWNYGYTVHYPNIVLDNVSYRYIDGSAISESDPKIFDSEGRIRLMNIDNATGKNMLDSEPNLHLSATANTAPIFAYVDEDGDGYVDDIYENCGIRVPYDKNNGFTPDNTLYPDVVLAAGDTGLQVNSSRFNFNTVVPPNSIVIKNDVYDYYIPLSKNGHSSTFFDNTYISINGTTVNGTAPDAPEYTAPEAIDGLTFNGNAQALVVPGTVIGGTMLYKINDGSYSTAVPTVTNAGTYVVYYKIVGNEGYLDVEEESFTVTVAKATVSVTAPTAVSGLTFSGKAQALINPGNANAGTLVYKLGEAGEYSTAIPTATNAGEYKVYYKVVVDSNYEAVDAAYVTVTVAKAAVTVTAPTAASDLEFNGTAQQLIVPGTVSNGYMVYRVGETGEYSTEIPTATDAGEYKVYYKIVTDSNHESVEGGYVTVTIALNITVTYRPNETPIVILK